MIERIGSGAYGEVWLARNTATGARRAVKIVHRATFTDERPFNREFEGIKKFEAISHSHPSQLAVFQVGKNGAEAYFYYAMELADSVPNSEGYRPLTLRAKLEQGRLSAKRVLEIAVALTEALAHLHSHGLIHRDVKPSNIIFVRGRPKLADIGLVTDASDSRSIVGTEGYLPAEGPGTPAADIFALGKVLYEALTGQDRRQFPELPADIRQWPDAKLAFELNTILLTACATNVRERYASVEAMLAELGILEAGKSVRKHRSLQQTLSGAWKAGGVALATAILISIWPKSRPRPFNLYGGTFKESGTTNLQAWQASRRAIQMAGTYTPVALSNAAVEYQHATKLDPNYAGAWSTLSICLSLAVENGFIPAEPALLRAKEYAEKAIQLAPNSGPPYVALAHCGLSVDRDFKRTEELFRKGISLNPANWTLRINFVSMLVYMRRFDEAEALLRQIMREEPSEAIAFARFGLIQAARGELSQARSSFDEAVRLEPNRPAYYLDRADVLWLLNDRAAAAQDWLAFIKLEAFVSLNSVGDTDSLRQILAGRGSEAFLHELISLLEKRAGAGGFVSSFDLARLSALAGNRERSLDYLEKAVDEHRSLTFNANVLAAFRDLRDEERFRGVLRRLNLN